ncbi:MAG: radical SAM protein [Planctomycetes bacterium]|nr:radical SAM protein [Planctomycetota bacterium]
MRARTFQVVSFGCKVNQAEGESLAARLRGQGLEEAAAGRPARLVIVNTCTVTGEAARQARQCVRRAIRTGAAVVVTGCAAHPAAQDAALRAIPEVLFLEHDKERVGERILQCGAPDAECGVSSVASLRDGTPDFAPPILHSSLPTHHSSLPRARALVKIQDGCPASCAYCIVPKVRPAVRSLAPAEAAGRIEALVAAGCREIVLCGIHLGLYGADLSRPAKGGSPSRVFDMPTPPLRGHVLFRDPEHAHGRSAVGMPPGQGARPLLHDLIDRLLALPGRWRVRLSSLEPMEVSDALLARLAARPDRLCPHLHVPLQSGSDAVLERMGRPYTAGKFLAVVERIRRALPRPAITTDVLVGFPGETGADHGETLRVCREVAFSRIHVFPFSRRPGTRAAALRPEVPRAVLRARGREVAALGEELAARFRRDLVGSTAEVVVERLLPGGAAEGMSERYVRVRVAAGAMPGGRGGGLVTVRLARAAGGGLEGEAVPG